MLLSPCGKSTPNPGMQIANAIMGYLGVLPPSYEKIRIIICDIFGISHFFVIDKASGLKHRIIYISPKVDRVSDVDTVLMGEIHAGHPLSEESRQTNNIAMNWAGKLPGSILMVEWGEHRIDKQEKPVDGFDRNYLVESYTIPPSLAPNLYGWDDPASTSSQSVRLSMDARKFILEVESGQRTPNTMEIIQKIQAISALGARIRADLFARFEERTKAMVDSLSFAAKRQNKPKKNEASAKAKEGIRGNILLIAGLSHLDPDPAEKDKRCDLKPLYDLIPNLSVMIISPYQINHQVIS